MGSHVHVVLKKDLDTLGRSGELVRVRTGYARNFLIPRGIATMATRGNIAQIEHEQKLALGRAEKARAAAREEASKLEGFRLQVAKEAGPEGKLYGSVTAQEIVEALANRGVEIDRRRLILPDEAIKETGTYDIGAKFGQDVTATFKLSVVTRS
jgi:large subunit ribosomal protein L9